MLILSNTSVAAANSSGTNRTVPRSPESITTNARKFTLPLFRAASIAASRPGLFTKLTESCLAVCILSPPLLGFCGKAPLRIVFKRSHEHFLTAIISHRDRASNELQKARRNRDWTVCQVARSFFVDPAFGGRSRFRNFAANSHVWVCALTPKFRRNFGPGSVLPVLG